MLTLESQLSDYSQEFINDLFSKRVRIIPKKLSALNVGVRIDAESKPLYYYVTENGKQRILNDEDLVGGRYDEIIRQVEAITLPACAWYQFARLDNGTLLLIDILNQVGDETVRVDCETLIELGKLLQLTVFPLYYDLTLTQDQQRVLQEWCEYTDSKKKKLLGSLSFARLVIYILTGLDPVTVCGSDIDGVLSGFIFKFADSTYDSEFIDPCFVEPVHVDIAVSPAGMVRMFLDGLKKRSVSLNQDKLVRWEKNFYDVVHGDSEIYNKFVVAAAHAEPVETVKPAASWSRFSQDFQNLLATNDLILKLFKYFVGIFITGDIEVPDNFKKEVAYYSGLLLQ